MKRTWVQILVAVLISVVFILGPPILANYGSFEVVAGIYTFLVVIAVITIPILIGNIIYRIEYPNSKPWDYGDYVIAWLLGILVMVFSIVIIGGVGLGIYAIYFYILNLLGG